MNRKWLVRIGAVGILTFAIGLGMFINASHANPQQPDIPTGHTYAMNNHGSIFYVTRRDYLQINGTIAGGWLIGFAAGLTNLWMNRRSRRQS